MRIRWLLFALLLLTPFLLFADPATHRLPDQQRKMQVWFGDLAAPYVVSGCTPTAPASLILDAFACEAYVKDTQATGELLYVSQDATTVGPLSAGDGTYWVMLSRNTTDTVSGWTRQAGTAYLWQKRATQPANPTGGLVIVQATVSGGTLTAASGVAPRQPYLVGTHRRSVLEFGAVADGSTGTDNTDAIRTAIASFGTQGGELFFPRGGYKVTAPIHIPPGVTLIGEGSYNAGGSTGGVSYLYGVHDGIAIVECIGSSTCGMRHIALSSVGTSPIPQTGITVGRSATLPSQEDHFTDVLVAGEFTKAAVYSISAEQNIWTQLTIFSGAKYGFYTDASDSLSVGGGLLTGAGSNTDVQYYGLKMVLTSLDTASAGIYIGGGGQTTAHSFFGGYLIQKRGAYVQIDVGDVTGADSYGHYAFYGVSGEINFAGGATGPAMGYHLTTQFAPRSLRGLIIEGGTLNTAPGGSFITQDAGVTLYDSRIKVRGQSGVPSVLRPTQIFQSQIDLGSNVGETQQYGDYAVSNGRVKLQAPNNAADYRNWDFVLGGASLDMRVVNDAYLSAQSYMTIGRSAATVLDVTHPNGKFGVGVTTPLSKVHLGGGGISTSLFDIDITSSVRIDLANPILSLDFGYIGSDQAIISAVNNSTHAAANMILQPFGGAVGIGKVPAYTLDVAGDINVTGDVRKAGTAYINPDYVFKSDYKLMPLGEVAQFIAVNSHLPGMASTAEVNAHGVLLFDNHRQLVEKVEEAYLYILQLEKRLSVLEQR